MTNPRHSSAGPGFTLIEVMVALSLLAVIAGLVFAIARTSLSLGKKIVDAQAEEMEQHAFFDLMSRRFSSLPGNARLDIDVEEDGNLYLSRLTLQEVPMNFTWGGQDLLAKAVQISTVKQRSGYLNIVLSYYENEILEGSSSSFGDSVEAEEPFAEITLLRDVAYFEWRVLNSTTMEWEYEWDDRSRLPLQLELVMAMGAKGEGMRHVFWLPPRQNPELLMRQMGMGESFPVTPASPTSFETRNTGVELEISPGAGSHGGGGR